MIIDNNIVFYCNGEVADIKASYILSDPQNEPLPAEYTYVATTHEAFTSYIRTNDTENWVYDDSAITGAKDWTNTVKLNITPTPTECVIALGTDLVNYSALGGHENFYNRDNVDFSFRALSFNPNKYYLKCDGIVFTSKTNVDTHTSTPVALFNPETSNIDSMIITLVDKNGNPVTYNGHNVIITPLTMIAVDDKNYFSTGVYFNDVQGGGSRRIWSPIGETSAYKFTFSRANKTYNENITNSGGLMYFPQELCEIEYTRRQINKYVETENYASWQKFYTGSSTGNAAAITLQLKLETAKQVLASLGMFFYWGDTLCMPLVSGNVTTGAYVTGKDIETTDSDLKKYTDSKGHTPVYPDHKDDDIETDMNIGNIYNASGLVKYYFINSSTDLTEIGKALSDADIVPTGKDLLPNLISLKRFCVDHDILGRGTSQTIKVGGVLLKDDTKSINATGIHIDSVMSKIDMGTITINGKYGSSSSPHFLDYSPYTEIQLYLPLCGWVTLPDTCMYKTISIEYTFDVVSGTCIAVVKSSKTVVATATGMLATEIPFANINAGIQTATKLNGVLNVASSALTLATGVVSGNPIAIGGGLIAGASAITNSINANNKNYTQVTGRTGDTSEWGLMNSVFLKIIRPKTNLSSDFAHVYGYLCNKSDTLSNIRGYTIVDNPDVHANCTSTELSEIKSLLSTGIYI